MIIVITGVPGTGKSSVAEVLSKEMDAKVIDLADFCKEKGLFEEYDEKTKAFFVDLDKLREELRDELKGDVIVVGHVACELEIPANYVFVLRTRPDELEKRLKTKGYPKKKVLENVLCEILDYCVIKAEETFGEKKVFEVDTSEKSPKDVALEIKKVIEARGMVKKKRFDFSKYLERYPMRCFHQL